MRSRLFLGLGLLGVAFLVLVTRLYALQIVRGEELSSKGVRNFVQRVRTAHDRGIIYDRYGRILVDNRPSLELQITPAFLGSAEEKEATLARVDAILSLDQEARAALRARLLEPRGLDRFVPIVVHRDLQPEQVEEVEADRSVFRLDGVEIVEGRRRTYRYGNLASHLLGYVNEIDPDRLREERESGNPLAYELGDVIGRAGVERTFEAELRGEDGYENVVVDAKGRRQSTDYVRRVLGAPGTTLTPQSARPGRNVVLTLDLDLQLAAEQGFDGDAGSAVAIDPKTGAILAYVSVPRYDPNRVSGALGKEEKARLDADPLSPWLNRPIQGQYAPGSTFKVVTAAAALHERATSPREKVFCPGYFRLGRHTWRCHKDSGHGYVDLKEALKVSCDTYFYTMAARIGIDSLAEMAGRFGFGSPSGIALRHEKGGIVPDVAYHNRVDRATGGYQKGMAINTAIGQGSLLVTPLQLAIAYAALANGGTRYAPRFVDRIETADARVVRRYLPETASGAPVSPSVQEEVTGSPPMVLQAMGSHATGDLDLSPGLVREIDSGLVAVTSEPGGTAYYRRSRLVSMAGKTGTAQVIRLGKDRLDAAEMDFFDRDHAWFAAYAPAEEPEIVVAVLNEHSGHGGSKAAPIAVRIIDAYFQLKQERGARAQLDQSSGEEGSAP